MLPLLILLGGAALAATTHAKYKRGWEQDRRDNEDLSHRVDAMCGELDRRYGGKKR